VKGRMRDGMEAGRRSVPCAHRSCWKAEAPGQTESSWIDGRGYGRDWNESDRQSLAQIPI
jgi:hypothetical protein